jgi:hypothetical protein
MPHPLDLLTLHEASVALGISYSSLSRIWRTIGLVPVKQVGRSYLFFRYAVEEYHLSYLPNYKGNLTLRWLPWDSQGVARVCGVVERIVQDKYRPPFFLAKRPDTVRKYQRRYSPIVIADWFRKVNRSEDKLNICEGFPPETRGYWLDLLQTAEGAGSSGSPNREAKANRPSEG